MAKKTFEVTKSKAFRVEPVMINERAYICVSQLYKTQKDPEWKFSKAVNIDLEHVEDVIKYLTKYKDLNLGEFTKLEFKKNETGKRKAPWEDE